jgi:hypothetical protein
VTDFFIGKALRQRFEREPDTVPRLIDPHTRRQ